MNLKKRLINLYKRREPSTRNMSDDEIYNSLVKSASFKKGFMKTATPVLAEKTYDMDASEHDRKSQAILEASYDDDKEKDSVLSKRQKKEGTAVEEGPSTYRNPVKSIGDRR